MTDHLTELESAARAATPGPLDLIRYGRGGRLHKGYGLIADFYNDRDWEFHALVTPERVLALIAVARAAEAVAAAYLAEDEKGLLGACADLSADLAALKETP